MRIFDKSRGPGGRLASRRIEWHDPQGRSGKATLDHGAIGFRARSAGFRAFVEQGLSKGWLAEWAPRPDPANLPLDLGGALYVPVPEMTALCRHLVDGLATEWSTAVDTLHRDASGWHVLAAGQQHPQLFDAVLLALPPAQAAPLLRPHRPDWAGFAAAAPMQPCWTLMGIAAEPEAATGGTGAAPPWQACRPSAGPLAWLLRSDSRPGRAQVPGQAHWVAHARPDWSMAHLEQSADWVQGVLKGAAGDALGRPVHWHCSTVHRWRYATPGVPGPAGAERAWWDAQQGLGACGDFLGADGVEGAWQSAQALSVAVLQGSATVARP